MCMIYHALAYVMPMNEGWYWTCRFYFLACAMPERNNLACEMPVCFVCTVYRSCLAMVLMVMYFTCLHRCDLFCWMYSFGSRWMDSWIRTICPRVKTKWIQPWRQLWDLVLFQKKHEFKKKEGEREKRGTYVMRIAYEMICAPVVP